MGGVDRNAILRHHVPSERFSMHRPFSVDAGKSFRLVGSFPEGYLSFYCFVSQSYQSYFMCKAGACRQSPYSKGLCQRLTQVCKGGTNTEIYVRRDLRTVSQKGYMFAGVIGAAVGRVDAVVGSKENGII